MKAEIIVTTLWDKNLPDYRNEKGTVVVSTVSRGIEWEEQLSPFLLGPCVLYEHKGKMLVSKNMENAWQYSKVYKHQVTEKRIYDEEIGTYYVKKPKPDWWGWAKAGWNSPNAVRYPMGKGAVPMFSWWMGCSLDYIEARKTIYGPLYAEAVMKTDAFDKLKELRRTNKRIVLLDFDARDIRVTGETLTDVLNCAGKKMGHAFVLAMLLTKDKALKEMELR